MKKYVSIITLLATVGVALAIHIAKFSGWDNLIKQSPEIFIARCISTLDFISASNKPSIVIDGMYNSDIEVVSVLKGSSNSGVSHLGSGYWPYRGENFLVFANYQKDQFNSGYTAIESYRVISLGYNFMTNQLAGKTLEEQVQLVLNSRLKDLDEELARDNEERQRIAAGLNNQTNGTITATNTAPTIQNLAPFKTGSF